MPGIRFHAAVLYPHRRRFGDGGYLYRQRAASRAPHRLLSGLFARPRRFLPYRRRPALLHFRQAYPRGIYPSGEHQLPVYYRPAVRSASAGRRQPIDPFHPVGIRRICGYDPFCSPRFRRRGTVHRKRLVHSRWAAVPPRTSTGGGGLVTGRILSGYGCPFRRPPDPHRPAEGLRTGRPGMRRAVPKIRRGNCVVRGLPHRFQPKGKTAFCRSFRSKNRRFSGARPGAGFGGGGGLCAGANPHLQRPAAQIKGERPPCRHDPVPFRFGRGHPRNRRRFADSRQTHSCRRACSGL